MAVTFASCLCSIRKPVSEAKILSHVFAYHKFGTLCIAARLYGQCSRSDAELYMWPESTTLCLSRDNACSSVALDFHHLAREEAALRICKTVVSRLRKKCCCRNTQSIYNSQYIVSRLLPTYFRAHIVRLHYCFRIVR